MLTRMEVTSQLVGTAAIVNPNIIVMLVNTPTAQAGEKTKPTDFALFAVNAKDPNRQEAAFLSIERPVLLCGSGNGTTVAGIFKEGKHLVVWDLKEVSSNFGCKMGDEIAYEKQVTASKTFQAPIDVMALDWNGNKVAMLSNGNLYVLDLSTNKVRHSNDELPPGTVQSIDFVDIDTLAVTVKADNYDPFTQFMTLE